MSEAVPAPADTGRPAVVAARTAEPLPRPQWQGLFLEPDLPPVADDEA